MTTYICTDGNADIEIDAESAQDAAREYVRGGDWDTTEGTIWITVTCTPIDKHGEALDDESEDHTIAVEQPEPECSAADHDWQSPHSVLGGLESNPGVRGHGGGVIITEVCSHCGTYRITDTWAQNPDTGEQGLESVEYRGADSDSLAWVESKRTYRIWWVDGSAPIYFAAEEAGEMAERYDFDPSLVGPDCDIELEDDDDNVIGGILEDK